MSTTPRAAYGYRAAFARLDQANADDGIRPGTYPRYGFAGQHRTAGECMDALRDRIEVLKFTGKRAARRRVKWMTRR